MPQLCLHQLLSLPWVFTACEPGFSVDHTFSRMLWKPSVLALTTTKSVLVPSLSPRLHVQGSTCLLGPPQPPKTLATMRPTPLPRSQLPLTQHQGVSWIPPAPFLPLQPLNIRSPIIVCIAEPHLPLSLASEAPGPPPSLFPPRLRGSAPQAAGFVTKSVCCAQLCLTFRDPMDCSPPGSSVRGICFPPGKILERVAISYSRGSS